MTRPIAVALGAATACVMALGTLLAGTASAADSIYWSRETLGESIRHGPLTGANGGSTPAQTLFNDARPPVRDRAQPHGPQDLLGNLDRR